MMDIDRFANLVGSRGARSAGWPEGERSQAATLIASDAGAADLLAEAAALDGMLDDWRTEPASSALRERVLMSAPATHSRRRAFADVRLWFVGAGVAAGVAGIFCGSALSSVAVSEAQDAALVASAVETSSVLPAAETKHIL